jgi:hypothetical protein
MDIDDDRDDYEKSRQPRWAALERLLAGFAIARVIEARPNSLIMQVESVHTIYPEAYWHAQEQGMVAIPATRFPAAPSRGE